jgi:predicted AAA+ superfamily ATPase
MTLIERYLTQTIRDDLAEKMVFIGGPRQVGKTTLAKECLGKDISHAYYNWDKVANRVEAMRGEWPTRARLIILDEFHKYRKWKTWLKGEWDTRPGRLQFLITGSAHLDIYRRGGDSLQGRYHYYTLHPFSMAEAENRRNPIKVFEELNFPEQGQFGVFESLFKFGGFPEPYIKQDERFSRRWRNERFERFFKEDIRELTRLGDFTTLALLADLLPERSASLLSINSLAEDLQVNYRTVANWMKTFEQLYYCFTVPAYQTRKIAALKKARKMYLWDWTQIQEGGKRLENLVAGHLLKFTNYLHDQGGYAATLHYLRDVQGREVDFMLTIGHKPWLAVEVKLTELEVSRTLTAFKEKLNIPFAYQVVKNTQRDFMRNDVRVMPVAKFLSGLV